MGWSARFRVQDGTDQSTDHRKLGTEDSYERASPAGSRQVRAAQSPTWEKVMQAQKWGSQRCMDEANTLDREDNCTLFLWFLFPP